MMEDMLFETRNLDVSLALIALVTSSCMKEFSIGFSWFGVNFISTYSVWGYGRCAVKHSVVCSGWLSYSLGN